MQPAGTAGDWLRVASHDRRDERAGGGSRIRADEFIRRLGEGRSEGSRLARASEMRGRFHRDGGACADAGERRLGVRVPLWRKQVRDGSAPHRVSGGCCAAHGRDGAVRAATLRTDPPPGVGGSEAGGEHRDGGGERDTLHRIDGRRRRLLVHGPARRCAAEAELGVRVQRQGAAYAYARIPLRAAADHRKPRRRRASVRRHDPEVQGRLVRGGKDIPQVGARAAVGEGGVRAAAGQVEEDRDLVLEPRKGGSGGAARGEVPGAQRPAGSERGVGKRVQFPGRRAKARRSSRLRCGALSRRASSCSRTPTA